MTVPAFTPATAASASIAWVGPSASTPRVPGHDFHPYPDSDAFLLSAAPYGHDIYVIELRQHGVGGLDLLRLLRRRSDAPVLALSTTPDDHFVPALAAGADMLLPDGAPESHLEAALLAMGRRAAQRRPGDRPWLFRAAARQLTAPGGTEIALTDSDMVIVSALAEAPDHIVQREALMDRLWGRTDPQMHNALHATVYRLRRRMEQDGGVSPLQAMTGQGYVFKARLVRDS